MWPGTTAVDVVRAGTTVLEGIVAQIDPVDPKPYEHGERLACEGLRG